MRRDTLKGTRRTKHEDGMDDRNECRQQTRSENDDKHPKRESDESCRRHIPEEYYFRWLEGSMVLRIRMIGIIARAKSANTSAR
jgi:hypothetical protein